MIIRDINSFPTVVEAIVYYTGIVAECSKNRDYTYNGEMLRFKHQLHERIKAEKSNKSEEI